MKKGVLWRLVFPRLRCPNCGVTIEGVSFSGRWHMPRKAGDKRGSTVAPEKALGGAVDLAEVSGEGPDGDVG